MSLIFGPRFSQKKSKIARDEITDTEYFEAFTVEWNFLKPGKSGLVFLVLQEIVVYYHKKKCLTMAFLSE